MNTESTFSETIKIYIAGSRQNIEDCCKAFCNEIGFCVTVTETNFIYTGGSETGFEIGIINYARFPSNYDGLITNAEVLAKRLIEDSFQSSCSIVSSRESIYITKPMKRESK